MAYSAPRNWSAGELVTASMMNSNIRDNFNSFFDGTDLFLSATGKVLLDGSAGHSYAHEVSSDKVDIVVGNTQLLQLDKLNTCIAIPQTYTFWLDGGVDTGFVEGVDDRIDVLSGGTQVMQIGPNAGSSMSWNGGVLALNGYDRGAGLQGIGIVCTRNTNATGGAGYINLQRYSATSQYYWTDNAGDLRSNTTVPTRANDAAGVVVGTQSSWYKEKDGIVPWFDYDAMLAKVVATPLHSFRFKSDSKYGNRLVHGLVGYSRDDWFMCNTQDRATPVLADSVIYGAMFASIKALEARVRHLEEI